MRAPGVGLQRCVKRVLALAAAGSLFWLPSLAVGCAISCDSASCETSAPACAAHVECSSDREQAPASSSHCPGYKAAGAISSLPMPLSGVGSGNLMPAHPLLVTSGAPLGPVAAFSSACPTPRSRSAPPPLRI